MSNSAYAKMEKLTKCIYYEKWEVDSLCQCHLMFQLIDCISNIYFRHDYFIKITMVRKVNLICKINRPEPEESCLIMLLKSTVHWTLNFTGADWTRTFWVDFISNTKCLLLGYKPYFITSWWKTFNSYTNRLLKQLRSLLIVKYCLLLTFFVRIHETYI